MSYTEEEEYAVYANIPYLIHGGMTVDEAQKELEEYGLTGEIDPEFSDENAVVIKKDDKVVHSIRGTQDYTDILTDLRIGTALPRLSSSVAAWPHLPPRLQGGITNYIPDSQRIMKIIKDLAPKGYKRSIPKTINPEVRSFSIPKTPIQFIKSPYGMPMIIGAVSKGMTEFFNAIYPDSLDRFKQHEKKFDKVKEKYPDSVFEFTGHSLGGGIANHLSRIHRGRAITYNSAPAHYNKERAHHNSVVYRTYTDAVSFLREDEVEDVKSSHAKKGNLHLYHAHSLTNFLPEKRSKISESKITEPRITKSKIKESRITESKIRRCEEDPTRPECRRVFYV